MMVSTKGRYALVVLTDLAKHQEDGFVSLSEVAERQKLSLKYLEIVVAMMNKGGLLKSCRGKNGGYRLKKEPSEYSINEILQLTEGNLAPVDCVKNSEVDCANSEGLHYASSVDRTGPADFQLPGEHHLAGSAGRKPREDSGY